MNSKLSGLIFGAVILLAPTMNFAAPSMPQTVQQHTTTTPEKVQINSPSTDKGGMDNRIQERRDQNFHNQNPSARDANFEQRDSFYRNDRTDKDVRVDMRIDRESDRDGTFYSREPVQGGAFVIRVKEILRSDPVFVNVAKTVDVIECNGSTIIFGVVNTEKEKNDLIVKIKNLGGSSEIQNRIIVK